MTWGDDSLFLARVPALFQQRDKITQDGLRDSIHLTTGSHLGNKVKGKPTRQNEGQHHEGDKILQQETKWETWRQEPRQQCSLEKTSVKIVLFAGFSHSMCYGVTSVTFLAAVSIVLVSLATWRLQGCFNDLQVLKRKYKHKCLFSPQSKTGDAAIVPSVSRQKHAKTLKYSNKKHPTRSVDSKTCNPKHRKADAGRKSRTA